MNVTQQAVAFLPPGRGGPLSVNATGVAGSRAAGFGGLGIGYEWSGRRLGDQLDGWRLLPAAEFEISYLGGTQNANLNNPTPRIPNHNFSDSFPMDSTAFLANAVLSLGTPSDRITPYAGFGLGTTYQSVHDANSAQVNPPEPGINHFNTMANATGWGFTSQAKFGIRFNFTERWWLFTEYRLLMVEPTTFTFGSTQYSTHSPTTPWTVTFGRRTENLGVAGIGFKY